MTGQKMTIRVPKSTMKKIKQIRASQKKPSVKALAPAIKRIQLNQCETQRKSWYFGANATPGIIQLGHNVARYYPTLYATKQGITNASGAMPDVQNPGPFFAGARVGNEIIPKGISIKLQLDNVTGITHDGHPPDVTDVNALHYRIIVFEYDSHIHESDVTDSLLFQGLHGQGVDNVQRTLDSIATNRVKVLKQYIVTQGLTTGSTVKNYYIKLNKGKMRYLDNNSVTPQGRDCAIALLACGNQTITQGKHVANASMAVKFTYKDP